MAILAGKTASTANTAATPATYSSATETELASLTPTTSISSLPPTYDDATASTSSAIITTTSVATDASVPLGSPPPASIVSFTPTIHFQIETVGKQWFSLPIGTRPDPIPAYRVESGQWSPHSAPAYTSLRFCRSDNSCQLIRGDDGSQTPVCTTLYRFGPGKPPILRLSGPAGLASSSSSVDDSHGVASEELDIQIRPKSITSRTQVLKTPYGTFRWRYASAKERLVVEGADQLLLCELVQQVALDGGKTGENATRIAQLVRGRETRSRGSGRTSAGNGGRLMVDLSRWTDLKEGGRDAVEGLVVASCICMLKKEVDRRRVQQMMLMGAGASGAV
ncbi:hypothetical protein CTRI78_v003329 [Colletotrichum trifolii]|uniref:Uncharacterized protein n=1 Tax=Colletotrichum trifolii TaxID=5466 RepID=A0A4R8RJP7_COLTR|nr:hypothetical protein CTRI78_v003329 [Colletotrichum trifolii]